MSATPATDQSIRVRGSLRSVRATLANTRDYVRFEARDPMLSRRLDEALAELGVVIALLDAEVDGTES